MKQKFQITHIVALAAGLIIVSSAQANADSITIQNNSFEDNVNAAPNTWTGAVGVFDAYSGVVNTSNPPFVNSPDGNNNLSMSSTDGTGTAYTQSQTTTYTASLGDQFTLTVDTTSPIADTFALTLNGTAVAYSTAGGTEVPYAGDPANNLVPFYTQTVTYTAALTGIVGVELIAPVGQSDNYDDVQLSVIPAEAPEPTTWAMLLGGVLTLMGWLRVRRQV